MTMRRTAPPLALISLALLSACGDVTSSSDSTYSQRCSDNADIEGFLADFGSYKKGKSIPFKHSDGYLFSLTVTERENSIDNLCQKHLNTTLESAYPIYTISLSAQAQTFYYNEADKENGGIVDVEFGQYLFSLRNPLALQNALIVTKVDGKDTMYTGIDSTYIDTLKINGVTYTGVAVAHGNKYVQPYKENSQNKTEPAEARLYYNTKKGILKIDLEDGSHIAINEED